MKTILTARDVIRDMSAKADPVRAGNLKWFFKTGPGEYGAGDSFIGLTVPAQRKIARRHRDLPRAEIGKLLASKVHEHRFTALQILRAKFERADAAERKHIADFYLAHRGRVNNWDLVDSSAPYILGPALFERKGRDKELRRLALSKSVWDRRIAMLTTAHFIRHRDFGPTLRVAELLLGDKHDLIHKAVGWMLREVGNKDRPRAEKFLRPRYRRMPRTILRYAIEKYPPELRRAYLKGEI